ncbi:MFS transporter [Candidatus Clostridium stratigraminis]|uniref:MFS transporter n=1 Tax=Candidatus Clostridium stratigraminis TaxID=3381661 RepID=A0ABW8T8V0_9CLOT
MGKKLFYGWIIVVATVLLNAMGSGVVSTLAVFLSPLSKANGYTQAQVSAIVSLYSIGMLVGSILLSKFVGKSDLRKLVLVFGVLEGIFILGMGLVNSLSMLYVFGLLIGLVAVAISALPVPILITNWFIVKKGTALGIATAGIGLGSAVFAPILSLIIDNSGYKTAFMVYGIIVIALAVISAIIIRTHPEEKQLKPYGLNEGDPKVQDSQSTNINESQAGMTVKEAIKTPAYWFVVLFVAGYVIPQVSVFLQTPSYLKTIGYTGAKLSMFISAFGICSMIGKVVVGYILDKAGLLKGGLIALVMAVVAVGSLILMKSIPSVSILYMVLAGGGLMMSTIAMPMYVSKFFGTKHYSTIFSSFMILTTIVSVIGSIVSGVIIDKSGFAALYIFDIIFMFVGALGSILALKTKKADSVNRSAEM